MTMNMLSVIQCNACGGSIIQTSDRELTCQQCRKIYSRSHGVYDFMLDAKPIGSSSSWIRKTQLFGLWRAERQNRVASQNANRQFLEYFGDFTGIESGIVLDIGCGSGSIRDFIRCAEYIGVDPIPVAVDDFPLVKSMGEHLPFKEGTFNHVLMSQVLDHCMDAKMTLREATRVLKNGGSIYIFQYVTDSDIRWPQYVMSILMRKIGFPAKVHSWETKTRRFTMRSFKRLMYFLFDGYTIRIVERLDIHAVFAKVVISK